MKPGASLLGPIAANASVMTRPRGDWIEAEHAGFWFRIEAKSVEPARGRPLMKWNMLISHCCPVNRSRSHPGDIQREPIYAHGGHKTRERSSTIDNSYTDARRAKRLGKGDCRWRADRH